MFDPSVSEETRLERYEEKKRKVLNFTEANINAFSSRDIESEGLYVKIDDYREGVAGFTGNRVAKAERYDQMQPQGCNWAYLESPETNSCHIKTAPTDRRTLRALDFEFHPAIESEYTVPGTDPKETIGNLNETESNNAYRIVRRVVLKTNFNGDVRQVMDSTPKGNENWTLDTEPISVYTGPYAINKPDGIQGGLDLERRRAVYIIENIGNKRNFPAPDKNGQINNVFYVKAKDGTKWEVPLRVRATLSDTTTINIKYPSLVNTESSAVEILIPKQANVISAVYDGDHSATGTQKLGPLNAATSVESSQNSRIYINPRTIPTYPIGAAADTKIPEVYRVDITAKNVGQVVEFRGKFKIDGSVPNNNSAIRPAGLTFEITKPGNNGQRIKLPTDLFTCRVIRPTGQTPVPTTDNDWRRIGEAGSQFNYYGDNDSLGAGEHAYRCIHKNIAKPNKTGFSSGGYSAAIDDINN